MAAGVEEGDAHMEELVDPGLGMEETAAGLQRRPSLKESYHSDSLLAPDTDFMTDGRSSAASGLDVGDRLTYLEQRMQMQEDEIQLLKMALADVLKRLNISEEHQAAAAASSNSRRSSGSKARPVSLALPSRPPMMTSGAASLKKSSTLCSSSPMARNYSPTPSRSGMRSPSGSVKDSPCKPTQRPTSAASACRKPPESKAKEAAAAATTRQVTHCKVTMQIYLSPLTRKTGSSEPAKSRAAAVPANGPNAPNRAQAKGKPEAKKTTPSFTLNLQKTTTSSSQSAAQDASSYKSPLKSPSQYFQICY
ncbi:echinoderm microtubule-associated protein-like 1 [Clinocottus analis]|uniref:echinoderm microtubule-associated protein-like 1 n=1 Tax=Clinocottus analis TaxID=304258 RepID=UPI0035BFFC5C